MSPPSIQDNDASTSIATRAVGVGASAGGLAALQQFLAGAPVASGLAYVVVQHLDPTHKAMLVELLARSTAMLSTAVRKRCFLAVRVRVLYLGFDVRAVLRAWPPCRAARHAGAQAGID